MPCWTGTLASKLSWLRCQYQCWRKFATAKACPWFTMLSGLARPTLWIFFCNAALSLQKKQRALMPAQRAGRLSWFSWTRPCTLLERTFTSAYCDFSFMWWVFSQSVPRPTTAKRLLTWQLPRQTSWPSKRFAGPRIRKLENPTRRSAWWATCWIPGLASEVQGLWTLPWIPTFKWRAIWSHGEQRSNAPIQSSAAIGTPEWANGFWLLPLSAAAASLACTASSLVPNQG